MKRALFFLSLTAISFSAVAQEILPTSVMVKHGYPAKAMNQFITFEMIVFTDLSNFTNSLDEGKTVYTKITDDTGFDLLAAQEAWEIANKDEYWYSKLTFENWGELNETDKPGFTVHSKLSVTPAKGAKTIHLEGVIAMVNFGKKEKSYELKGIIPGTTSQSEIGEIEILGIGNIGSDEAKYDIYKVFSKGKPIVSATVIGGDDREEAAKAFGMDVAELELGEFDIIYKSLPEKIDITVVAKDVKIVEIPFELDLSIGF